MLKRKKLLIMIIAFSVITVIGGFFAGSPVIAGSQAAKPAPANRVIYNFYATDGIWKMADGLPVYSYGFIGGPENKPLRFLGQDGTLYGFDGTGIFEVTDPGDTTSGLPTPAPTPGASTPFENLLAGNAQFPAPLIYATVGDVVEIRLKNLGVSNPTIVIPPLGDNPDSQTIEVNAPNDPHSIHLHALDVNTANDGVPETSVAAIPANGPDPGAGNVVVYMFSAKQEGTFFYHCHQEASIHVTMGMWGSLIIYGKNDEGAKLGPNHRGTLAGFKYDKDYIMLLTDTDVRQHISEAYGNYDVPPTSVQINTPGGVINTDLPYNPVDYKPQYWFVNGLSFPQTIHGFANPDDWSRWIAAHPGYDPFIVGSSGTKKTFSGKPGEKILVRVVNMGFQTQPMHVHGFHAKVITKDQRPWFWANNPLYPNGQGMEINTLTIGSGETYDLLFDLSTQTGGESRYPGDDSSFKPTEPTTIATPSDPGPGTESRFDPESGLPKSNKYTGFPAIPGDAIGADGTYIGGPGVPQLFVFHNHDDYKATNNGLYPGGMFTAIKVNP